MSQSATLYRISMDIFRQLEMSDNKQRFDISFAKTYTTFQGSFMGLEYILSKGQDTSTSELINEIFNPKLYLGGQDFESLTREEQMEFYKNSGFIRYLDPSAISKLKYLLEKISEADIEFMYDANELNDNGIYPEVWHNDNSPDKVYNSRQISDDLEKLKTIIKQAETEKDYIFVFVG